MFLHASGDSLNVNPIEHFNSQTVHIRSESVCSTFSVCLRQLPEGVWGVAGTEIPGLNVEAETQEQAQAEVSKWAHELLVDNKVIAPDTTITLVFY